VAFLPLAELKAALNYLLNFPSDLINMLPASARLRKSSEISAVMKSGTRFSAKLVVLHVALGTSGQSKVAFVVGKNVGNSVIRHRVTRQLRHIVSPVLSKFPIGSHVVVRALPAAATATFTQLTENLEFAMAKVPNL
jgi:ribonuclease P protein component